MTIAVIGVCRGLVNKCPRGRDESILTITAAVSDAPLRLTALERIENGDIDPPRIAHRMPLSDAVKGFGNFLNEQDNCGKVVRRD